MDILESRLENYRLVSERLASLSNSELSSLLDQAKPLHSGITGNSSLLMIKGRPVFVKSIALTDLEQQPENIMSTANLFELPLFYQYGIGSAGFGAWRELAAHIMATGWVVAGQWPNFPLMYHWRIMPAEPPEPRNASQTEKFENDVKYWENDQAIRNRLEALHSASAHLFLFLEYFPQTLHQWLECRFNLEGKLAEVEESLQATLHFLNSQGLVHFDAHFKNILTDGTHIYLSDFGLSLSSRFDLSTAETEFFNTHRNYDRCSLAVFLLYPIFTSYFEKAEGETALRSYLDGKLKKLPLTVSCLIEKYAPMASVMEEFYRDLKKDKKAALYPSKVLESLLLRQKEA